MSTGSRKRTPIERELWWQLRIELLEVTPTVWRRIIVPETITLPRLHRVLQAGMGWKNSHLHEFVIIGVRYGERDPDWDDELKQVDERRVVLYQALGHETRCFDYIYDFGDDWHHIVVVEDPYATRSGREAGIQCTAGQNACPPEDVGVPRDTPTSWTPSLTQIMKSTPIISPGSEVTSIRRASFFRLPSAPWPRSRTDVNARPADAYR